MVETESGAILHALEARRSMARVRQETPPRDLIEKVLEAGAWAPNHHRTEPWRFIVLAGQARQRLGDVMAQAFRTQLSDPQALDSEALVERQRRKPLRAPVIIVVAVVPSTEPKVREVEELAAGAAAVQNMLLAAEALGLGAMWRTGSPAYEPAVLRFLELPQTAHIVAFLYLGYPDPLPTVQRYRTASSYTRWLGWEGESGSAEQ